MAEREVFVVTEGRALPLLLHQSAGARAEFDYPAGRSALGCAALAADECFPYLDLSFE